MYSNHPDLKRHLSNIKNLIPESFLDLLYLDGDRFRIFDPISTFYCFLNQVLCQGSCKEALISFNIARFNAKLKVASANTAAYVKAKNRLSPENIKKVAVQLGHSIDKNINQWKWKNRDVYLVDGTLIDLEDLDLIKNKYPVCQAKQYQVGQPKLRLLGVFSHASGAFLDGEIGGYAGKGQSEIGLIKKMLCRFKKKSILVMDRFFSAYYLQDLFLKHELDFVIRSRDEFAKKILEDSSDKVVVLKKPQTTYYKSDDFKETSNTIKVRFIKTILKRKGFKDSTAYIVTSLIDLTKSEVEDLYQKRWQVEGDIRNLKCTLGARMLRSKSPKSAENELWMNLIAYNVVRKIICIIANVKSNHLPRSFSFKTILKTYLNGSKIFGPHSLWKIILFLLEEIVISKYRKNPREIKKRNNRYPLKAKNKIFIINNQKSMGRP
jgi:hypothetical protein